MTSSNGSRTCTQNASAPARLQSRTSTDAPRSWTSKMASWHGVGRSPRDDEKDLNGIAFEVSDLGRVRRTPGRQASPVVEGADASSEATRGTDQHEGSEE